MVRHRFPAATAIADGDASDRVGGVAHVGVREQEPLTAGELIPWWQCDIVVCHGGNNTVTEALTAGLPVLAAPFSTDQFAGAEDLRRAGLGDAIDPATTTADEIGTALTALLVGDAARRAAALGAELRRVPAA